MQIKRATMVAGQCLLPLVLCVVAVNVVQAKKQQLSLSDSYLPVAMQIIAHLTDQMSYEVKDEPNVKPTAKPTAKPTNRPNTAANRPTTAANRPTTAANRPTTAANRPTTAANRPTTAANRPTSATNRPTVSHDWPGFGTKKTTTTKRTPFVTHRPQTWQTWRPTNNNGWMMSTVRDEYTTPFHRPGLYAPLPPKHGDRNLPEDQYILLPIDNNYQHTIIEPPRKPTSEALLSPETDGEVKPLIGPKPANEPYLPFNNIPVSRTDDIPIDDDDNLQYLSSNLKDMLKLANDPNDERAVDIWGDDSNRKAFIQQAQMRKKLSASNLRLLLLYDLLSREAKRQRLSDYNGFSPDVMKALVESANGGARSQLSFALSKMVDRKDCQHDYANNRAKEMVQELGKDESTLSSEIRYLQPLGQGGLRLRDAIGHSQ